MAHPYMYQRKIPLPAGLVSIGEAITGTGDVWSAVNTYCFIGPNSDGECRMCIAPNAVAWVGYEGVVYRYFGPTSVCIGSGGEGGFYPHYTTVDGDWIATGTTDHTALSSRDTVNSHPQSAITDLVTDQAAQDTLVANHAHTGADGTVKVAHTSLSGRYTADQHRIANITDLQSTLDQIDADQQVQNAELARLETDKLDTADAVEYFSFAAYLGKAASVDTGFPNLGAAWQDLDFITEVPVPGKNIVSLPLGQFSLNYSGGYFLAVSGAVEHNSSNSGRKLSIRLYNYTTGVGGTGIVIGTGRNSEATSITASFLAEILAAEKGQALGLQIGNADTYSAVNFQTLAYSIFAVSNFKEPLP